MAMEVDETEPAEQEIRRPDQITGLEPPFSAHTFFLLEVIIKVFATGAVAVFGLITNVINIVVFYRQGIFSNSSTVSLVALAVSDFCCCLLSVWGSILGFFYHFVDTSTWKWEVFGFIVFTAAQPLSLCAQITCWNTAFMAFERMISVAFPFKVKSIFTPRRSLVVMICIFVGNFILHIPNMMQESAVWETNPDNNVTYIGWQPSKIMPVSVWLDIHTYLSPVVLRFSLVFIVILCNAIILWKVKISQKFRKTSAFDSRTSQFTKDNKPSDPGNEGSSTKPNLDGSQVSNKEMKLLRIITTVSVVFTVCYMIHVIHSILFILTSDLNVGYHWYAGFTSLNISIFFQILNSSTNIIIYYSLSSRFRSELHLCLKVQKN